MFLKYILIDKSYSAEVLRNKFGHNLNKLWSEAKSVLHNSGLNKFDALVDGLNEFEELRYPGKGYKITISVHKHTQLDGGYGSNRTKHYQTCLEDIDEFVTTILKDIVNPEFVKSMLMGDALAQYHRDNKYPFF
jgi:hypothetical protein